MSKLLDSVEDVRNMWMDYKKGKFDAFAFDEKAAIRLLCENMVILFNEIDRLRMDRISVTVEDARRIANWSEEEIVVYLYPLTDRPTYMPKEQFDKCDLGRTARMVTVLKPGE